MADKIISSILNSTTPTRTIQKSIKPVSGNLSMDKDVIVSSDEDIKDQVSSRKQREVFTKNIITMMASELIFIAILISLFCLIPFINSITPHIAIRFPSIINILICVFVYLVTSRFLNKLSNIQLSQDKTWYYEYKDITISILKYILKLIIIIYICLNCNHIYSVTLNKIELSNELINMILYTTLAVFIKTTILAGFIIHGLYDVLKSKAK